MTAVFSIVHIPSDHSADTFCYEHHETISSESNIGSLKTSEWCDYLAHELCDPHEGEDPDNTRLMRRGLPPTEAVIMFEFFVTPVKTPIGVLFISDYRQGHICPPIVAETAMGIYSTLRKWIKMKNNALIAHHPPSLKKERDSLLKHWHSILFSNTHISYKTTPIDYPPPPTPTTPPPLSPSDSLLSSLMSTPPQDEPDSVSS